MERLNRDRPQAAKWRYPDWLRLANIVLAHRRLPLVALFSEHPPSPEELLVTMELPCAARFVDKPPRKNAKTLRPAPLDGLFERAQMLISAVFGPSRCEINARALTSRTETHAPPACRTRDFHQQRCSKASLVHGFINTPTY